MGKSRADKRFDRAIEIVLNSGVLDNEMIEAFWSFVDGDASEADFRYAMNLGPNPAALLQEGEHDGD